MIKFIEFLPASIWFITAFLLWALPYITGSSNLKDKRKNQLMGIVLPTLLIFLSLFPICHYLYRIYYTPEFVFPETVWFLYLGIIIVAIALFLVFSVYLIPKIKENKSLS